jgi:hypothetical protein
LHSGALGGPDQSQDAAPVDRAQVKPLARECPRHRGDRRDDSGHSAHGAIDARRVSQVAAYELGAELAGERSGRAVANEKPQRGASRGESPRDTTTELARSAANQNH